MADARQPPLSVVGVGGRAVPANGGNIYDHFEVNYLFPNGYRVSLANRQSTGCFNGTLDFVMGTEGTLMLGSGPPRIETPDGKVKWQWQGEEYDMYQREHDVLFAAIRSGQTQERRSESRHQHAARADGPPRRVLGAADHVGPGAEFAGQPRAEAGRLERQTRSSWSRHSRPDAGVLISVRRCRLRELFVVSRRPAASRPPLEESC